MGLSAPLCCPNIHTGSLYNFTAHAEEGVVLFFTNGNLLLIILRPSICKVAYEVNSSICSFYDRKSSDIHE